MNETRPEPRPAASRTRSRRMLGVPELDPARVQRWAHHHIPEDGLDQVRVEVQTRGKSVTVVERRAPWRPEAGPEWSGMPIAQLRYDPRSLRWTLYWATATAAGTATTRPSEEGSRSASLNSGATRAAERRTRRSSRAGPSPTRS